MQPGSVEWSEAPKEGLNHGGTPRLYSIGFAGGSYPACRLTALLQTGYTVRDNVRECADEA